MLLWLPYMDTPIIIKETAVIISFFCPGPPIPISIDASWTKAAPPKHSSKE